MERLDDAIERVAFLKNTLADFGFLPVADETNSQFSRDVEKRVSECASTLSSNDLKLIPVNSEDIKKVRIITSAECMLSDPESDRRMGDFVAEQFKKRGAVVDVRYSWDVYLEDFEADEIDRDYDLIVYCVFANSALPLYDRELVNLHSAQRFDNDKTIVMVIGTPHYLREYFPLAETTIHTYKNLSCIENAVASIYGEREFVGKLPII